MKKFCESLREHANKIINFKNKRMKLLTNEQQESNENANICCIFKEKFKDKKLKIKRYCKVRDLVIQVKIVVLYALYVIQNIVYLRKLQ